MMANFNDNVPEREKRLPFKYLDICIHKFGGLVGLNLLYTLCSLPVIAIYFLLASLVASNFVPQGAEFYSDAVTTLTVTIAVFMFISLGGGPVAPGFIYVLRNFVRREHAFILSDFFENIKKNFKQSIVVFIIDIVLVLVLFININAIFNMPEMFFGMHQPFAYVMVLISAIYIGARIYMYPLMVTFKAPVFTIIKTSFMLFALKLPQTILVVLLMLGVFFLVEMLPFIIFILFVFPLFLASFINLIGMVYGYDVISKNIVMEEKEEKKAEKPYRID